MTPRDRLRFTNPQPPQPWPSSRIFWTVALVGWTLANAYAVWDVLK